MALPGSWPNNIFIFFLAFFGVRDSNTLSSADHESNTNGGEAEFFYQRQTCNVTKMLRRMFTLLGSTAW